MSENKKAPMENGAKENHGISNSTGMLAIPAADVKHFLESILSTGLHAVVTKQGNSMRHEWGQTPDELVSLASTKTDCWFSPAGFSSS